MKGLKSFFKLLCFVFIAFFVIGFGGEKVFAVEAPSNVTVKTKGYWIGYESLVKYIEIDGKQYYVFCLNSTAQIPFVSIPKDDNLYVSNPSHDRDAVALVVSRAYDFGLNDGNSSHTIKLPDSSGELQTYTVSETDLYGITQSAVWFTLHGTSADNNKGGYTQKYQNWISSKGYTNIFNALTSAGTTTRTHAVYLYANGSVSISEKQIDGKDYLVSNEYGIGKVNVPDSTNYTLSVNGGEISVNGDSWTTSATVKATDKFVVRMVKPETGAGSVSADLSIKSQEFIAGYNAIFYNANNLPYTQNMGLTLPYNKTVSSSSKISGNYENETKVYLQKVDSNNKRVAGALLGLYDDNGSLLGTFESVVSGDNPSISLPVANGYYIKELSAPTGFILNDSPVYFDVVNNSGTIEVQQDGKVVSAATISIKNDKIKVKYRKVDENGNGIPGVEIRINDYAERLALNDEKYVCAITDDEGYLTKPCSSDPEGKYYNANGEYEFRETIFDIEEASFPKGYYVKYFEKDGNPFDFYFGENGFITMIPNNVRLDGVLGKDATVVVNIINDRYIAISKTDMDGKELVGAEMHLYDGEVKDYYAVSDKENWEEIAPYVELDSWISDGTAHKFVGIKTNHKYILREEVAPSKYIKLTSDIEFTMDENGKVTVLNQNSSTDSNAYELIVKNDYTQVTFSKSSATTGDEVPGAHLKICTIEAYNLAESTKGNGNDCDALYEWDSTTEPHQIDMLEHGGYVLIETLAPIGYVMQTNAVKFAVDDSGILKVEMINEPTQVTVSKKDFTTGDEIEGAHLKICTLESYKKDGSGCVSDDELWSWVSKTEPHYIEAMPLGDYVLIEVLPDPKYEEGMVIDGELMTAYEFSLTEDNYKVAIDVYNKMLTDVPKTGISTLNLFAIGGLLVFAGYETIKIYRKRTN